MSLNQYVTAEVKKIYQDETLKFPKNVALSCAWIMGNKKGVNLKVIDLQGSSSLSEYFILGSATNTTQAKSIADEICTQSKLNGVEVLSKEGFESSDWLLIDLGDVLVHIFLDTSRDIYDLDSLWAKYPEVEIPQDYYFSQPEGQESSDDENNYF